jgi:signal transduction histidine kinase
VLPFVGLVALLAVAIGATAVSLVGRSVEDRIKEQLRDTLRLLSGEHFPLSDDTARRLARVIHAEVVVVAGKRIQATSLAPGEAHTFEQALAVGEFPLDANAPTVREGSLGTAEHLVAAAPLEASGRALYLLYPRALVSEERSRATRPVLVLALVGVGLTALLGALKERSVVRAQTAALAQLVSALAHEVKNPLGAIGLTVETLRAGASPRDQEAIDVVASEVERLALLVDELRLVGGGPKRFVPERVLPGEAVASVLALLRRTFEHRGLTLETSAPKDAPRVLVDPRALKQALLNLLLNAIEASPRGGTVTVRVVAQGGRVRFEVEDQGPGVPEASRSRLFEPFVTTKEGGTGLGLALARLVAREHAGSLELVPSARGARFALELPAAGGAA